MPKTVQRGALSGELWTYVEPHTQWASLGLWKGAWEEHALGPTALPPAKGVSVSFSCGGRPWVLPAVASSQRQDHGVPVPPLSLRPFQKGKGLPWDSNRLHVCFSVRGERTCCVVGSITQHHTGIRAGPRLS